MTFITGDLNDELGRFYTRSNTNTNPAIFPYL